MTNYSKIKTIWLRSESRPTERRTPLLPDGVKVLMDDGYKVVVERSDNRIISNNEYEATGCQMVDAGGWMDPPEDAIILGLKELPEEPSVIKNAHILFAHAYKEQLGWKETLTRFKSGNADLLDIEYMTRENGTRVVAFGYRAGYMGAALALLHWFSTQSDNGSYLDNSLIPFDNADLLDDTIAKLGLNIKKPKVLIIGAGGRCGAGAADIFERHGAEITRWDREETQNLDRAALLDHDIMINCAFIKDKQPAFVRKEDRTEGSRLSIVTDVSCDPFSDFNPVPLYDEPTSWDKAYINVDGAGDKSIDLIAIDNLPSLLPRESSEEFAELMLPHLRVLNNRDDEPVWRAAKKSFDVAVASMENK